MQSKETTPPPELVTGPRIFRALCVPFGEPVADPAHVNFGRVLSWGDVRLPRREVPVDVDHDPSRQVGLATGFVKDRAAVWASLRLGAKGVRLARRGYGLSVETDDAGEIIGLSLCVGKSAAFAGAKIVDSLPPDPEDVPGLEAEVPFLEGRPKSFTIVDGTKPPPPPSEFRVPDPVIRDDNPPDPEAEAARLQACYEDRLESFREAEVDWEQELAEMMRRNKAEFERQLEERDQREQAQRYEEQREVQHLAYMLAAAAVIPPRRWWRRLLSLGTGGRL